MHGSMLLLALTIAIGLRWFLPSYQRRWQITLFFFLFPPLLLLMTVISVVCMGYRGQMLGYNSSLISYFSAIIWLVFALFCLIKLSYQTWRTHRDFSSYPLKKITAQKARVLAVDFPYSARVGFWKSELIVTQGLLNLLDQEHLQAVLAHEQAHQEYHDTFWFFWLGWLRSMSSWLPNSENLWSELVFLRELRADKYASGQVDYLLLAESLLLVAEKVNQVAEINFSDSCCVALNDHSLNNRLLERIDALVESENPELPRFNYQVWLLLSLSLAPFLLLPLHS
ncbi:MAG: M56 family metallopeptidase [Microcystis sp.]|jgi:Zn-dependent protease with chaperone function|uniref:M56 family peptidase n=1 Tax=Microcystis flos-aquae Mf_QC_C_20070823_S10D TaxID=2486236 RepID=A0A552L1Z2_9CHRO|nr:MULTISPECIES: M56 family metallopeptidase [unclassified Microcystis]MCA2819071.1 M56 family metallopeptidase [Microcystis sp. M085S1]MCA2856757.1 M56 family metallopeptidase [Microcystis sp. M065S1]MCZ8057885.1 M56 family metallopeptidase [Microcystis sp. LE19-12.2C]MDJ0551171.1 M56 family metallopeptidase [Microcystis sp. M49637_WE12]TRT81186.1 MAG: M56 family peptidase [Microcystis flos-aquae Ma_QC_C_20070823_S18]TRU00149.1 MAG: M56 family peptidase [Microcystis flos-aquae Ma_QC_C_200708